VLVKKQKLRKMVHEMDIPQITDEAMEILNALLERHLEELLQKCKTQLEYAGRKRLDKETLEVMGLW